MTREPVHNSGMTEADTCRDFVTPKIVQAGWSDAPFAIGEQRTFTNWAAAGSMDTDLSFSSFLELYRADVSERRVPAHRVVEPLDVVEHI